MSEPLTGAESVRPETFAEKSRREALAAALSEIQALREGKVHPHVYRSAAGHQQKLQERKEAAQKFGRPMHLWHSTMRTSGCGSRR